MSLQLTESRGRVLGFKIGEKISGEEMHDLTESLGKAIGEHGKIRLLVEIEDFRHMAPEALLEKLKFAIAHSHDIERMAVVSDRTWIKSWVQVGGPVSPAQVRHFFKSEKEEARRWLGE